MITSLPAVLQQYDESLTLPASVEAYEKWSTLLRMALRMENAFLNGFQMNTDPKVQQLEVPFRNLYTARHYLLYWSSMILLYE